MGLETAHPEALERLNKRMTLDDFAAARRPRSRAHGVALRVFVLVAPPFVPAPITDARGSLRSIDVAIDGGASVDLADPDARRQRRDGGAGAGPFVRHVGRFETAAAALGRSEPGSSWTRMQSRDGGRGPCSPISGTCERFADVRRLPRRAARPAAAMNLSSARRARRCAAWAPAVRA